MPKCETGYLFTVVITEFAIVCIECGEWYILDEPWVQHNIARFGHSAVVHDNKMFIFGGFNGIVLGDLFVYEPGEIVYMSLLLLCVNICICFWDL